MIDMKKQSNYHVPWTCFYKTKIIMYMNESIYKIYTLFLGTEKKLERVAFGKKQLWPWVFQLFMIVSIWKSCAWIYFIIQNKNAQKCNINHLFA